MTGLDVGDAEVADQACLAQLCESTEVLGYRLLAHPAQVDEVEVVSAELAQVLLHMTAQILRTGRGAPLPRVVAVRADLGGDEQIVRVRGERGVDEFVGGAQRGEVEGGSVDVVHAEVDRLTQHGDGAVAITGRTQVEGGTARQPHRTEADATNGQVAELPGARGVGGDRCGGRLGDPFAGHRRSVAHRTPATGPGPPPPTGRAP